MDILLVLGVIFVLMLPYLWPFAWIAIHIYQNNKEEEQEEEPMEPLPIMRVDTTA
jgi:hypothetical protein